MENYVELDKHIFYLANKGLLSLSKINWPVSAHRYFDYHAEINIHEFKVVGRGTATCENTAIRIAFAEAFERLVVKENKLVSTNGCAVHLDEEKAKTNALYELRERDCFLFHHHFGFNKNFKLVDAPNNLLKLISASSVKVEVLQYKAQDDFFSITAIEFQHGIVLGINLHKTASISLEKSFIEAYRQYIYFDAYSPQFKNSYKTFGEIENYTYNDHGNLLFDMEYIKLFKQIFNTRTQADMYVVKHEMLRSKLYHSKLLPETPLTFVKVESKELLDLYFGYSSEQLLAQRAQKLQLKPSKINSIPHPLR